MDLKVLVLVALALGMGFVASETDMNISSVTNTDSFLGPSIQDLDLNGSKYVGQNVSLSGEAGFTLAGQWSKSWLISGDYSVRVDCSDYIELQPGNSYSIEGVVENKTVVERNIGQQDTTKEIVFVRCTSAP